MTARNIWFIGTGKFAALCLEGLIRHNMAFRKIITGNPTRSGRSGKDTPFTYGLPDCESVNTGGHF